MIYLQTSCVHGPIEKLPAIAGGFNLFRRSRGGGSKRECAVHRLASIQFNTPAQGDTFNFTVRISFTWCISGSEQAVRTVERLVDGEESDVVLDLRGRLEMVLRPASRGFPPYEIAAAEQHIGRTVWDLFSKIRFDYVTNGGLNCVVQPIHPRAAVELQLSDAERAEQQKFWIQRWKALNEHAYTMEIVPKLNQRRAMWQQFLREGQKDWLTPYAVALAQNHRQVAEEVENLFKDRRAQVKEFSEELNRQAKKYEEADAFELMMHNDTVLRRLVEVMGIPLPPPEAEGDSSVGTATANGERHG